MYINPVHTHVYMYMIYIYLHMCVYLIPFTHVCVYERYPHTLGDETRVYNIIQKFDFMYTCVMKHECMLSYKHPYIYDVYTHMCTCNLTHTHVNITHVHMLHHTYKYVYT